MKNKKIDIEGEIIGEMFTNYWFIVPEYQRPYVWEKDNIDELIDDIDREIKLNPRNEYFIGSFVLKKDKKNNYEVLDGQQRLTTILLIYAVLRELIKEKTIKENLSEFIHSKENKVKKIKSKNRIDFKNRGKISAFINEYVVKESNLLVSVEEGEIINEKILANKGSSDISKANLAGAIEEIYEKLKEKSQTELKKFVEYLTVNVKVVRVITTNIEDAFQMFSILNDRGINLTSADILKVKNIGKIEYKDEINNYSQKWEDIQSSQGENFERFLQIVRNTLVKEKAQYNLLKEYEEYFKSKECKVKPGKEFIDLLELYNTNYNLLIEHNNERETGISLDNSYKNLITIMKHAIPSTDWIAPLLYFYNKYGSKDLNNFLRHLEYKFVANWISGISPTRRLDSMNKIMIEIDKSKTANELLKKDVFKVNEEEIQTVLKNNVYGKPYAKYVLMRYEFIIREVRDSLISEYKNISIEHILPQTPPTKEMIEEEYSKMKSDEVEKQKKERGKNWFELFTIDEMEEWKDKVANLILLNCRTNSTLSNLTFNQKKKKYYCYKMDSFKASQIYINSIKEWNKKELKKREIEMIGDENKVGQLCKILSKDKF